MNTEAAQGIPDKAPAPQSAGVGGRIYSSGQGKVMIGAAVLLTSGAPCEKRGKRDALCQHGVYVNRSGFDYKSPVGVWDLASHESRSTLTFRVLVTQRRVCHIGGWGEGVMLGIKDTHFVTPC